MIGVLELGFGEAFMVVYCAVSDELDLGLARDSFEIGVQNRLLGALGFVVAMSIRLGLMSALRSDLDQVFRLPQTRGQMPWSRHIAVQVSR